MAKVIICENSLKPRLVSMPSSKGDGTTYMTIPSTLWNDPVCDCKGYEFRGRCRHVEQAEADKCNYVVLYQGEEPDDKCVCGANLVVFTLEPEYD